MIEKDGGHWMTAKDATLLLIYIKELEAYTNKLELQNQAFRGDEK